MWKQDLKVSFVRRSSFFIEVLITDDESGHDWHLVNLYASTNDGIRKSQWEELLRYRQHSTGDWVLWGDFNDLLWEDEKQGGWNREIWTLKAFRQFTTDLGAVDIGYYGYPFTWVNRRFGIGLIQERLDRVLVSPQWGEKHDKAQVRHLFSVGSDHSALLLDTNPPRFHGSRQFRFDSRWNNDPACRDVIRKGWGFNARGSKMFGVFQKVKNCRRELRTWSKQKNFNARNKINELQSKLERIRENKDVGEPEQVRSLEKELGTAWGQ